MDVNAMPKLPDVIEIGYSRKRLAMLFVGSAALTAASAAIAFHWFPGERVDLFMTIVGYLFAHGFQALEPDSDDLL